MIVVRFYEIIYENFVSIPCGAIIGSNEGNVNLNCLLSIISIKNHRKSLFDILGATLSAGTFNTYLNQEFINELLLEERIRK